MQDSKKPAGGFYVRLLQFDSKRNEVPAELVLREPGRSIPLTAGNICYLSSSPISDALFIPTTMGYGMGFSSKSETESLFFSSP
jgi:hypothetical protein